MSRQDRPRQSGADDDSKRQIALQNSALRLLLQNQPEPGVAWIVSGAQTLGYHVDSSLSAPPFPRRYLPENRMRAWLRS